MLASEPKPPPHSPGAVLRPLPTLLPLALVVWALAGCGASQSVAAPTAPVTRAEGKAAGPAAGQSTPWTLHDRRAGAERLAEVRGALDRCALAVAPLFPRSPRPLRVLVYGTRESFVAGLRSELNFSAESAAYFATSSAPRPLEDTMPVPPDQPPTSICHELVHHYMESHVPRARLLRAKWFDEGVASYLAARALRPAQVAGGRRWLRKEPVEILLPIARIDTEERWGELHRSKMTRNLAYTQSMLMVAFLFERTGDAGFAELVRLLPDREVAQALVQVTGWTPQGLRRAWIEDLKGR